MLGSLFPFALHMELFWGNMLVHLGEYLCEKKKIEAKYLFMIKECSNFASV
jgi:hypothetical protein